MDELNLDEMEAAAKARLRRFIARSAGQHMRAIRAWFYAAKKEAAGGWRSPIVRTGLPTVYWRNVGFGQMLPEVTFGQDQDVFADLLWQETRTQA